MSRTRKLSNYKDGKPQYTPDKTQHYRFYRHERVEVRRHLNRSKRHTDRAKFKKFGITPGNNNNTNGWKSW